MLTPLLHHLLLLLLLLLTSTAHAVNLNLSHLLLPPPSPSSTPALFHQIIKEIAAREGWDLEAGVKISEFDAGGVSVGESQRYEFHVRVGKGRTVLVVRFSEVDSWRRIGGLEGLDMVGGMGMGMGMAGRDLELDGPLDVHVRGADGEIRLLLPSMNMTQKGLRRVLVGTGIKIKVEGAQEVSLAHPYGACVVLNGSLGTGKVERSSYPLLDQSSCSPLLSVRLLGPATVIAHKTHNSKAFIQVAHRSRNTIELLPDKCYSNRHDQPIRSYLLGYLHSRLTLVEEHLQAFLGYRVFQNSYTRFLKAKITSPTLVKFRMELERNITENDRTWKKVAEWRTKPVSERQSFDIVARAGGQSGLVPLVVKKVKRGYTIMDSTAWSNLMSNISFTQFPSIVVPPEALTLDVKW